MDSDKIKKSFFKIANIGKEVDGSITRLLFSKEYKEALEATKEYMEQVGLETYIDSVSNLHGIYTSNNPNAKTIMIGSHLDTVDNGGRYDGLLGVVAGIETVRELKNSQIELNHNLEIIAFNGEEGNDLGGTFGSRCAMGLVSTEEEGYLEKAEFYKLTKEDILNARMDTNDKSCFLELHIEQGDTLEKAKEDIGIVKGIVGLVRYKVIAYGQSNHSGTTMMKNRKDAMTGMANLMVQVDHLARKYENHMVATFGKVDVFPNAVAVIPGKVEAILEIRNLSKNQMDQFYQEVVQRAKEIENIEFSFEKIVEKMPQTCDDSIIETIQNICDKEKIKYRIMPSGATHDSIALAYKMPIGMIFVPSKDGISHNGAEYTEWKQVMTGIELLYKTVKEMDHIEF